MPAPKVEPAPPGQVTINIGGRAVRFTMDVTAEVVEKRKKRKPVVKFPGPVE